MRLGEFAQASKFFLAVMTKQFSQPFKKSRKYGESAADLHDRLDFVAALLALADEKITVSLASLKAQFKLEWVKEDELRVSGLSERKQRNGQSKQEERGTTQDDLGVLLENYRQGKISAAARKELIQNALSCLRDLGILKDSSTHKNQGFWIFSLCLKHETAEREENLQVIKDAWKEAFGSLPEIKESRKDEALDWSGICRRMLQKHLDLTSNDHLPGGGSKPRLDRVYVPLALVERQVVKENQRHEGQGKEEEKLVQIEEDSFFEEVLRLGRGESQGRRIAIIGEPGSGKTTRLQKIADWILQQDLGLPIWISLAGLEQRKITQYLREAWLPENLSLEALQAEKQRIWLLLDGVDEMTTSIEKGHVSQLLDDWTQEVRVVVTCRLNVWEADKNAFSGFEVFRNLPFEPEQVESFIRKWFEVPQF